MAVWTQVEVPLGGVDQYTDLPHVQAGELVDLKNARFRSPPTLAKRYGYHPLSTANFDGSTLTTGVRLIRREQDTLLCTSKGLYTYSEKADKWSYRGDLSDCHVSRLGVYGEIATDVCDTTSASRGQLTVVAWNGSGGLRGSIQAVVIDNANDTVLSSYRAQLAGQDKFLVSPRVVALGNYIYIVARIDSTTSIYWTRIDITAGSYDFPALTLMATTATPNASPTLLDVYPFAATHLLVTYNASTGEPGDGIYLDKWNISTHAVDASVVKLLTSPSALAVEGVAGENVYWAWANNAAGGTQVYNDSLASVAGPSGFSASVSVPRIGITRASATSRWLHWEVPAATIYRKCLSWRTVSNAAALGFVSTLRDVTPVTKGYFYQSTLYIVGRFNSNCNQDTFYLLDLTSVPDVDGDGNPIKKARWVATMGRDVAVAPVTAGHMPDLFRNGFVLESPLPISKRFTFADVNDKDVWLARSTVYRYQWDFATAKLHSAAKWGRGLFFAGGRPSWFDGHTLTEHGFAWRPEPDTQGAWGAGGTGWLLKTAVGGYIGVGPFAFSGTYEHEDANAMIARSAPSTFYTFTPGGAGTNVVGLINTHDLELTLRQNAQYSGPGAARIFGYRTTANDSAVLYRASVSVKGGLIDNTGGEDAAYGADANEDDAGIANNDVLYTTGDILDNAGTPPCKFVTYHQDRLWIGGCEDPDWIWFSQPYVETEQPRFNEALRLKIGGTVTALFTMDESLIAFTETDIYAVSGSGPPATGGLDMGFAVTRVSTDVGCIDWRSVVLTPAGLFFQSIKGIYLLGRDYSVKWVGDRIKDTLSTYSQVTSAVMLNDVPEVRFTLANPDYDAGIMAVYNYQRDAWALDTFVEGDVLISACTVTDGYSDDYRYGYLRNNGRVRRETSLYDSGDPDAPSYLVTFTTPWFHANTIQGWQRIRKMLLLASYKQSHGITVDVGFDYALTWEETHTFTPAQVLAATNAAHVEQLEIHPARQECEAVRFRVSETMDALLPASQGCEFRSLVLELGLTVRGARAMELPTNARQ